MSTKKPTKIEMDRRRKVTESMLLMGQKRSDILRYFNEKYKDIDDRSVKLSDSSIEKYITNAYKAIDKAAKYDRTRELGKALKRLEDMYCKSASVQDFKTALAVQKEIIDLLGLRVKDGTENATPVFNFTFGQPLEEQEEKDVG